MKIYTRTGDGGETGLFGGTRVSKASARVVAYGAVDELNAALGLAASQLDSVQRGTPNEHQAAVRELLPRIQSRLFEVGAELALAPGADTSAAEVVGSEEIAEIERAIDRLEGMVEPLANFILPGGPLPAATLHLARTICRRAERDCVALGAGEEVRSELIAYMNRLSDLLFVMARVATIACGAQEIAWRGRSR